MLENNLHLKLQNCKIIASNDSLFAVLKLHNFHVSLVAIRGKGTILISNSKLSYMQRAKIITIHVISEDFFSVYALVIFRESYCLKTTLLVTLFKRINLREFLK